MYARHPFLATFLEFQFSAQCVINKYSIKIQLHSKISFDL
jgi:hypothetical protein